MTTLCGVIGAGVRNKGEQAVLNAVNENIFRHTSYGDSFSSTKHIDYTIKYRRDTIYLFANIYAIDKEV